MYKIQQRQQISYNNYSLTSPARKRETPLSEMSPTSIQTNPHNIRLWPFCVFSLVLQGLLYHLISFHGRNTMLVVLVVVSLGPHHMTALQA